MGEQDDDDDDLNGEQAPHAPFVTEEYLTRLREMAEWWRRIERRERDRQNGHDPLPGIP